MSHNEDPRLTFALALMNAIGSDITPEEAGTALRREWRKMEPKGIIDDKDRLIDLVRYCRAALLDDGLITPDEFSKLTSTRAAEGKRLESYDAIIDRAEKKRLDNGS